MRGIRLAFFVVVLLAVGAGCSRAPGPAGTYAFVRTPDFDSWLSRMRQGYLRSGRHTAADWDRSPMSRSPSPITLSADGAVTESDTGGKQTQSGTYTVQGDTVTVTTKEPDGPTHNVARYRYDPAQGTLTLLGSTLPFAFVYKKQ